MTREVRILHDRLILQQCRQGKDEGFEALVKAYERPLFYYLRRLVAREEDCWDILQEVWIRAFRSIRQVRAAETLSAWLYKVARSALVDLQRKAMAWEPYPEDDAPGALTAEPLEPVLPGGYTARDVHAGLDRLRPAEREALTLYFLEGFQIAEIAEITGVAAGTVKARLHWARRNLRSALESERC